MTRIPEQLDDTVRGFSVTYWIRPGLLYLIQYSPTDAVPCFRREDGIRKPVALHFNADELYAQLRRFAHNNRNPEAADTDCPSISVGIATEDDQLFTHVKLTDVAFEDENLRALKLLLDEIVGS